jgi:hypothetical protein
VAAFLSLLALATSTLILSGFVICAEYRWVTRLEYLSRVQSRHWELYGPVVAPAFINEELY